MYMYVFRYYINGVNLSSSLLAGRTCSHMPSDNVRMWQKKRHLTDFLTLALWSSTFKRRLKTVPFARNYSSLWLFTRFSVVLSLADSTKLL